MENNNNITSVIKTTAKNVGNMWRQSNDDTFAVKSIIAGSFMAGIGFVVMRYKTSRSNEWLVRTGLGIKNMQIAKKFVKWPFQNVDKINLVPTLFKLNVNSMSKEKMEFKFPAVFTIGPKNNMDSLAKYSTFFLALSESKIESIVRGIIEGQTRSLAANLSIEEIFTARIDFKNAIISSVQTELDQYGLEVYNGTLEELTDSETSNYFKSLAQKIKAEAENRAKIEVSEAEKRGTIGSKEREADTRQRVAVVETETQLVENTREQEIVKSKAELDKLSAEQKFIVEFAKIKSEQDAEIFKMERLKQLEIRRQEMELEKQRATELTKSIVTMETQKLAAEAHLYTKQKEASGILATYQAQSEGLQKLIDTFGGDSRALLSYTMLEKGVYEKLASANAEAIRGLNPKITVWTSDAANSMDPIKNLGKSLIPMLDTIHEQTGYVLPEWMVKKEKV